MGGCTIQVTGLVQGVGFRPFVHSLAIKHGLCGTVRNQVGGVYIEVEGDNAGLESFFNELETSSPLLAEIHGIARQNARPKLRATACFEILPSEQTVGLEPLVPFDAATCQHCLDELLDPGDRRHHYAFLNCTHCGPRFTIIASLPYDRVRTSLVGFPMCPDCASEYEDLNDRRFHAEATACPDCGPRLFMLDESGTPVSDDKLARTLKFLDQGKIAAIKGLGGFHLVCSSAMDQAVKKLRLRKRREDKPFAIMARDIAAVESICYVNDAERSLLQSSQCPIVLLKKRPGTPIAEAVAPRSALLGVMLPNTPLHHLLLRSCLAPLVVTSGNLLDDPIVIDNDEAVRKLGKLADFFLMHDRPIRARCDDSVARVVKDKPVLLRRARGYAPAPVRVRFRCDRAILAVGGQQKATFAFGRERNAILSHHLGDLDGYESFREYERALDHYRQLFVFEPEMYVHDRHPDYASSRLAIRLAAKEEKPCFAVQHHHAHMASCMAENGLTDRVIGVTFDGTGLGTDETIWGGEFLVGDCRAFERAAHFRAVVMPGGTKAIMEPWRMAASYLIDAGEGLGCLQLSPSRLRPIEQMIRKGVNSPLTTSCGRFLDGVAAILGLRHSVSYEGQAAMELEGMAARSDSRDGYPFRLRKGDTLEIDTRPVISAVVRDVRDNISKEAIAGRVHRTVIEIIGATCHALREKNGLNKVVLSGGVFCNAVVSAGATDCLEADGFDVFTHLQVPPNDGGLSLGQLAVAAAQEGSQ